MLSGLPPGAFQYPAPKSEHEKPFGVYPIDFLLESIIESGIQWFIDNPEAPDQVFGHLKGELLNGRYGQEKIDEIAAYIRRYEINVVQHFSLAHTKLPSISIQLMDASEDTTRSGLGDFERQVDVLNAEQEVVGRSEVGYTSVMDSVHIGIHTSETPDLAKYLYYLIVYILNIFKPEFQKIGVFLGTFNATDVSRLNEYLPENIYSRFITFQCWTIASIDRGAVPIIEQILGVHLQPDPAKVIATPESEGTSETEQEAIETQTGLTVCDIRQSDGG